MSRLCDILKSIKDLTRVVYSFSWEEYLCGIMASCLVHQTTASFISSCPVAIMVVPDKRESAYFEPCQGY